MPVFSARYCRIAPDIIYPRQCAFRPGQSSRSEFVRPAACNLPPLRRRETGSRRLMRTVNLWRTGGLMSYGTETSQTHFHQLGVGADGHHPWRHLDAECSAPCEG